MAGGGTGARDLSGRSRRAPRPGSTSTSPSAKRNARTAISTRSPRERRVERWLEALAGEASGSLAASSGRFDTLYVGGGTPSLLERAGIGTPLRDSRGRVRLRGRLRNDDRGESRRRDLPRARDLARSRHQSGEPRRAVVRRRRASLSAAAARRGARARGARAAPGGGLLEYRHRSHLRIRGAEHRPVAADSRARSRATGRSISPAIR